MRLSLILTPDFNMAATMGFVDPLRAANYLSGASRFAWRFATEAGGPCRASNGAVLETATLPAERPDIAIISASWTPERHATPAISAALRRWARAGTTLGGIDTGAFVLAEAGLLKGRRATAHSEHLGALAELYPDIEAMETLCVFDDKRMTCAGGVAAVDFGLHLVADRLGEAQAAAAARYLFHPGLRGAGAPQNPPAIGPAPAPLKAALAAMEAEREEPLSIAEIAALAGVSHRQLDRLFASHFRRTPGQVYRGLRLDRAHGLVTQTDLPLAEIAVACGFASPAHFSRAYRQRFARSPSQDRVEGRVPFEFRGI